jgi:WD40 repeat protein
VRVTLLNEKDKEVWEKPGAIAGRDSLSQFGEHVLALAYSPDGKYLAAASAIYNREDLNASVAGRVILWDLEAGKRILVQDNLAKVDGLAFSPNGQQLALACFDKKVLLWKIESVFRDPENLAAARDPNSVSVVGEHEDVVWAVAFHPKKWGLLASAGKDKSIFLWDVTKPDVDTLVFRHQDEVQSLAFSPDGAWLLSTCKDKTARLWNLASRKFREFKGHRGPVNCAAFSPDGKQVATGSEDGEIIVWDLKGQEKFRLQGHTRGVFGLAFHPTEARLASVGQDMTVRLWDLDSGQEALALKGNTRFFGLAFSPDGRTLAAASGGGLQLWDAPPK